MSEKRLILFIYEVLLLNDIEYLYTNEEYQIEYHFSERLLDPLLIEFLNHFIIDRFEENKELLAVIFDVQILEKFVKANYNILEINILSRMLSKYRGKEKYLELIESVGKETDSKLNELALNFINYYKEALELSYALPNIYQKVIQ